MKKYSVLLSFAVLFLVVSCEYFNFEDPDNEDGLTADEIIEGLKAALEIGTDSSTLKLSALNGYYMDALVKIPLPEEAQMVQNKINVILDIAPSLSSYLNLDQQFENVVMSINRAAEHAAQGASPIFGSAIRDLTIAQGWDILNGVVPSENGEKASEDFDSTAATKYFKNKTYDALVNLYAPEIDAALDQDLGLNFSANQAWHTLRTNYNNAVDMITGNIFTNLALQATGYSLDPIETESIGVFATEKALNGLFFKVGEEEKKIRHNPFDWAMNIIQKVFGYIQEHWDEYTGGE